jgi:opacity protein-like surface antigen
VSAGAVVGFTGLWRVTPYFAWGGGFEIAAFRYDPPKDLALTETGAAAVWLGLIGRVYFNDEGSFDPYLQLGIGVGALGTTATDPSGTPWEETGAGPAAQIGGGIDFHLSRSVKLGPGVAYTRVLVDKIRRCRASGDGDCVDLSKDDNGYLNAYFALTARLTILLGGEL